MGLRLQRIRTGRERGKLYCGPEARLWSTKPGTLWAQFGKTRSVIHVQDRFCSSVNSHPDVGPLSHSDAHVEARREESRALRGLAAFFCFWISPSPHRVILTLCAAGVGEVPQKQLGSMENSTQVPDGHPG